MAASYFIFTGKELQKVDASGANRKFTAKANGNGGQSGTVNPGNTQVSTSQTQK